MKISFASKVFASDVQQLEVPDLFAWIDANRSGVHKDSSPVWSPTLFSGSSRRQEHAVSVCALVFDFDHGRPELPISKVGVCHLWHTTARHSPQNPRWRLVIPLDEPVPSAMWPQFWHSSVNALGVTGHDESCSNVGRFYYVTPVTAKLEVFQGKLLPVNDILSFTMFSDDLNNVRDSLLKAHNERWKPVIKAALSGAPVGLEGNRDNTVTGLGFYLGRSVVDTEVSSDAVYRVLERGLALPGPETKAHWEGKFKAAFERGRLKRQSHVTETNAKLSLDEPWAAELQTIPKMDGTSTIISNTYNASVILKNEGTWRFRKNVLEDTIEFKDATGEYRRMADTDATKIMNWLQKEFKVTLSRVQLQDQCEALADDYDPLRSYIESLRWDGVVRCDNFLADYFGCDDNVVTRMYSRKWLVGLVARALRPGCKLDTVLVLQGDQGKGKSTALRLLVEPWFSDSKVNVGDKDSLLAASRFWCHEFAELASLKRADLETMKAFITSTQDSYRPPYGRAVVQKPRRCVFVASTNEDEFLADPTGARRFWVVFVRNQISFEKIQRDRDQVVAEAVQAYKHGETWWLETQEQVKLQRDAAAEFQIEDNSVYKDAIRNWWARRPIDKRPDNLTASEVVTEVLNIPVERTSKSIEMAATRALKDLGFVSVRRLGGVRKRAFRPPLDFLQMPQRGVNGEVTGFKQEKGSG